MGDLNKVQKEYAEEVLRSERVKWEDQTHDFWIGKKEAEELPICCEVSHNGEDMMIEVGIDPPYPGEQGLQLVHVYIQVDLLVRRGWFGLVWRGIRETWDVHKVRPE